jgi:hypothetical protein
MSQEAIAASWTQMNPIGFEKRRHCHEGRHDTNEGRSNARNFRIQKGVKIW